MPDDVPQVPLTPNPPIPTAAESAVDPSHPLALLPQLPEEAPIYLNGVLWICIVFVISIILVILVCRHRPNLDGVASSYISNSITFFTVAVGAVGANQVSRRAIYAIAASKNGIQSNNRTGDRMDDRDNN